MRSVFEIKPVFGSHVGIRTVAEAEKHHTSLHLDFYIEPEMRHSRFNVQENLFKLYAATSSALVR